MKPEMPFFLSFSDLFLCSSRQMGEAIAYLHAHGVCHRDLYLGTFTFPVLFRVCLLK
jgi:serine/threonine protein kinase